MIRSDAALLRHAQDFFLANLVGVYSWGDVRIAPPELREAIPANIDYRKRRQMMEARAGLGRYVEQARICFEPWELLIYSSVERPPLGEVALRNYDTGELLIDGPLDSSTWRLIGLRIREETAHQRKAS